MRCVFHMVNVLPSPRRGLVSSTKMTQLLQDAAEIVCMHTPESRRTAAGGTAPAETQSLLTEAWNSVHSRAASVPSRSSTTCLNLSDPSCVRYCFPSGYTRHVALSSRSITPGTVSSIAANTDDKGFAVVSYVAFPADDCCTAGLIPENNAAPLSKLNAPRLQWCAAPPALVCDSTTRTS